MGCEIIPGAATVFFLSCMNSVVMKNLLLTIDGGPKFWRTLVCLIHFLNFISENTEMGLKITWGVSDTDLESALSVTYTTALPNS